MTVLRIVANIPTTGDCAAVAAAREFYRDLLGLELRMDLGWIATYGNDRQADVQISLASQGGSGAPVPVLSISVDHIDDLNARAIAAGHPIAQIVSE